MSVCGLVSGWGCRRAAGLASSPARCAAPSTPGALLFVLVYARMCTSVYGDVWTWLQCHRPIPMTSQRKACALPVCRAMWVLGPSATLAYRSPPCVVVFLLRHAAWDDHDFFWWELSNRYTAQSDLAGWRWVCRRWKLTQPTVLPMLILKQPVSTQEC